MRVPDLARGAAVGLLSALFWTLQAPAAAAADEPPPKPTKVTGDLAYVNTAGNSDVQTLTGTEKVEHKTGKWLFTQDAAAVWGEDDGQENAGRYMVGLRGDREISKRVSFYLLGMWRRNAFAAISRQFDEGAGFAYHALIPNPHQLDLEAGGGASQRVDTNDAQDDFGTGRLGALYRYYFKEKAYFEWNGVYLHNFKNADDYEWDAKTSIAAPVAGILALKLGYSYHYRNRPLTGIKKWDSTFAAGVQLSY